MAPARVLFMAANPREIARLEIDREARAIQREIDAADGVQSLELVTRWAAQPLDLLREVRSVKPQVLHFAGHGGNGGLVFHTAAGGAPIVSVDSNLAFVTPEAIAETIGAAGSSLRLVTLSGCYSARQAQALLSYLPCVVGVPGALDSSVARAFSASFYRGLIAGRSIGDAFLCALDDQDVVRSWTSPTMAVAAGVDPLAVFVR